MCVWNDFRGQHLLYNEVIKMERLVTISELFLLQILGPSCPPGVVCFPSPHFELC